MRVLLLVYFDCCGGLWLSLNLIGQRRVHDDLLLRSLARLLVEVQHLLQLAILVLPVLVLVHRVPSRSLDTRR